MPSVPLLGEELAGYRLRSVLGRGGMSVVFGAENARLGNVVALKVLAPELSGDERFRARFLQESRTAASLNHPNVIPIYDSGTFEDLLYLSMRYVAGSDLRRVLRAHSRLSGDQALLLIGQAGRALDAAHRAGLVHRDVKPANILVEQSGEGDPDHVYLADFGISKHALSISGLTTTGEFVGTLDYIAPEQIRGERVDARTDIYSLGCVLYECLTGRVPFQKDIDAAVIWAHVEELPEPPSAECPELPRAIDDVVLRAMAKRADDRYGTCRELMAAAHEALSSRPAPGPHERLGITERPPTVLSPQVAGRLSGETSPADAQAARPRTDPEPSGPRESARATPSGARWRSRRWMLLAGIAAVVVIAAVAVVALGGGGSGSGHGAQAASSRGSKTGMSHADMSGGTAQGSTTTAAAQSALMSALAGVNGQSYSKGLLPMSTCKPQSATKVTCTNVTNSASDVVFETYPSLAALYRAYTAEYQTLTHAPFRANYNDCNEADDNGEVSWNHAAQHSHQYSVRDLATGAVSPDRAFGRLFCTYSTAYDFYIVWTQNQGRLLGIVTGGPHRATWDWWHKVHHEISFSGAPMSMSGS